MTYYKVLNDYKSCSGGTFDWASYLPYDGQPGDWTPVIEDVALCDRGYHGTDATHLIDFIDGNQLWEVEVLNPQWEDNKFVCQSMRLVRQVDTWNDRTLRLFAVWCAREALKLVDNPDPRSVSACDVAERYANGQAIAEELAAAWAAARDAARAAAWAAWAASDASAAAWAAAWAAARKAQSEKVLKMLEIG